MSIQVNAFIDANHAHNKVTRRSHTGVLIYLNKAPIIWFSKSLRMVDTSTFGSEFIALKMSTELIKSLCYKLYIMGVPVDGPAKVLVDNNLVVRNSTIPSSTLQKQHKAICYHYVHENVAAKIICIAFIPSAKKLADMFTKLLGGMKLKSLCQRVLY